MKQYKFIYFCEDLAHRTFIEAFLKKIPTYLGLEIEFQLCVPEGLEALALDHSCSEIMVAYKDYYFKVQTSEIIDLFVYGRDVDSSLEKEYINLNEKLTLNTTSKPLHILFLPVSSIEHWFLHLKRKGNNIEDNSVDLLNNKQAKFEFYGNSRPVFKVRQRHINLICNDIDIDFLASKSSSFNIFLEKTIKLIQNLNN